MNLDAANRDPALERTPIGALEVLRLRNGDVVVAKRQRGHRRATIIYTLEEREPVWNAVYGKAPLEAAQFDEAYRAEREAEKASAERAIANKQAAFHAELSQILRRHPDLLRLFGWEA